MKERLKEYLKQRHNSAEKNLKKDKLSKNDFHWYEGRESIIRDIDIYFDLGLFEKENKEQEWIDGYKEWQKEQETT